MDVIDWVPGLGARAAGLRQEMSDARLRARQWTRLHGEDIPEVRDWVWPDAAGVRDADAISATAATGGDNE